MFDKDEQMNPYLVRASWIVAITAVLALARVHNVIEFPMSFVMDKGTASTIGFVVIVAVAIWATLSRELGQRSQGPTWVWGALLGLGLLSLATLDPYAVLPGVLARLLRYSVVETLIGLALAFLFLKSASELNPFAESDDRDRTVKGRILFGLTVFIGLTFQFIPDSWLASANWDELRQGKLQSAGVLPSLIHWALAFVSALVLVTKGRLDERVDADRPGLGAMRVGIVLMVFIYVVVWITAFVTFAMGGGAILVALVGLAVVMGPLAMVAKLLLTFGALRLLLTLQPAEVAAKKAAQKAAPVAKASMSPPPEPYLPFERSQSEQKTPEPTSPFVAAPNRAELNELHEMRAAVASEPLNPQHHERLHRALASDPGRLEDFLQHAREYLAVLLGHSMNEKALALFRECAARDPEFKPAGDQVSQTARLLLMNKDGKAALRIMNKFDAENPNHRHTPQIYYLCALIMKGSQQTERAKGLLQFVLDRYPNDKIARDAKALLATL